MKRLLSVCLLLLSVSAYASSSIKVVLNPSTSNINLADIKAEVSLLEVYDFEGCLVMSSAINKSNPVLEVHDLQSGRYRLVGLDVFKEKIQEGSVVIN